MLSLDPSTNCTGWAVFHNSNLVDAGSIKADSKQHRWARQAMILDKIVKLLEDRFQEFDIDVNSVGYTIASEEPMVQGKNGLALHKFLGALEGLFKVPLNYIHPSTVKKLMGSGKLDKLEVALSVGTYLESVREQDLLANLITKEDFDATDAIAIGLCYLMKAKERTV